MRSKCRSISCIINTYLLLYVAIKLSLQLAATDRELCVTKERGDAFLFSLLHTFRLGDLAELKKAGSLHQYLTLLHDHGRCPVTSFWWGKEQVVSVCSPQAFKDTAKLTDKAGYLRNYLLPYPYYIFAVSGWLLFACFSAFIISSPYWLIGSYLHTFYSLSYYSLLLSLISLSLS